ncbi:MAG: nucleoside hydrolase [Ruminococcaceae bacterium]|nr:nucleoside hydrolase [Oscillospiraceae bacterium]
MKKVDIIFDCDPGHDDVVALLAAVAHPEVFNILGITTVAGNNTLDNVTNNILSVIDHLEFDIPVYKGYATPMRRDPSPAAGHGKTGLDGPVLKPPSSKPQDKHALDFLYETLISRDEPLTIVAIGPLTNIGVLLMTYPEVKEKIEKICIMGGGIYTGNVTQKSEFNLWHDPEGAKIVFRSGVPIVMSGLEVCHAGGILHTEYVKLEGRGRASQLVFELYDFFSGNMKSKGIDWSPIYDLTTILQIIDPSIFKSEMFSIDIETEGDLCRGMTVADQRPFVKKESLNVEVLMDVDREAYIGMLFDALDILDKRYQ